MKFFKDGLIILSITALLFLGFEACIRLFAPQGSRHEYFAKTTGGKPDSILGHVNNPGAHYRTENPEFIVEYKISGQGFRDEAFHAVPKSDSLRRILILGDSFAFGAAVDFEYIWPVILEQQLKTAGLNVDVIKAGVSGYDTRTELLYLERLFPQYQPDLVIVAFLPNDLFTNQPIDRERLATQSRRATQAVNRESQDKAGSLHTVTFFKRLLMGGDFMYAQLYGLTPRAEYFKTTPNAAVKRKYEITKSLLQEMDAYCRPRNASFAVVSIPQQFQTLVAARRIELQGVDVHAVDRRFSGFARETGFPWVETLPRLAESYQKDNVDLYFRYDGHLTREGNKIVADLLAEQIGGLLRKNDGKVD